MDMDRRAFLAGSAAVLSGCTGGLDVSSPPRWDPARVPQEPGLVLVLGSGGPRGFAHIGVLRVLEDAGIKPQLIVGASVGAIIGALLASGKSATQLELLAANISPTTWTTWRPWSGFKFTNTPLATWLDAQINHRRLEDLPIPLVMTAVRERDNTLVQFNTGNAGLAASASAAVPAYFAPVQFGGESYVDGDVVSPVPMRLARSLKPKFVLAIDVSAYPETAPADASEEMRAYDSGRKAKVDAELAFADFVLHPDIGYWAPFSGSARQRAIDAGRTYTQQQLPKLKASLKRAGV
jgi:NTE family protein